MNKKKACCIFFMIIIAFLSYKIINNLGLLETNIEKNTQKCHSIPTFKGAEDFVIFQNKLISAADNRLSLWDYYHGVHATEDGQIFSIDPSTKKVSKIEIINWPKNVSFHPHGIDLFDSTLYVINHAYEKGGERIDMLDLEINENNEIKAKYKKSFIFDHKYYGIFNDLVVISENEYYITQWRAFPQNKDGRDGDLISEIKFIFPNLFTIKLTYVFYCKNDKCEKIPETKALMNNGIVMDKKSKRLYVTSTTDKEVYEYSINDQNPVDLKKIRTFKLDFVSDNLVFDENKNQILISGGGRPIDYLNYKKIAAKDMSKRVESFDYYSGYSVLDLKTGIVENVVNQKKWIYGASVAMRYKNEVYLGSWGDNRVMICEE